MMFDISESLIPKLAKKGGSLPVLAIGFDEQSLEELESLLGTLGATLKERMLLTLRRISPATYIGAGKLEEIKKLCEEEGLESVVIDAELSPKQLKNIEKVLNIPTIDRAGIIIEIFSRHARTKEAKTQVELARLEYLLPRLSHFWTHFEKQRGGIGQKGMGESQLEVDRRLLKDRMKTLRSRLKMIEVERNVQRAGRKNVLKVALVGYTNAGKSTLLNALTQSNVLAENKLFATLDASVRALDPFSHPPLVAIDTVGFISRIPPGLIASFRSTLEELQDADLLLHVVDASSRYSKEQYEVTEEVLRELHLEAKPRIAVMNKVDLIKSKGDLNRLRVSTPHLNRDVQKQVLRVSAINPEDVNRLRQLIVDHFTAKLELWEVVIPYSESKLESQIQANGSVEKRNYLEKGAFYRVRIHSAWAKKLGLAKYRP